MMKNLLLVIVVCCMACVHNGNTRDPENVDYQREALAIEWLNNHYDRDDVTVSCPSKRWGTPLCDVKDSTGKVIFWLGCHIGTKDSYCIQEKK